MGSFRSGDVLLDAVTGDLVSAAGYGVGQLFNNLKGLGQWGVPDENFGEYFDDLSLDAKNFKLNPGAQGKHIPTHNNYQPGKSIFTYSNPQQLIDDFAGQGKPLRDIFGQPGYRERIDFGQEIGLWVDEETGIGYPTTKGIVIYSKRGVHIVPARP